MDRPIPKKWLEPFRLSAEMGALDYEASFTRHLPRRTALNRLREARWIDRQGETRATVYRLTEAGRTKLDEDQTSQPSGTDPRANGHLSRETEDVRRKLRSPASERPVVGYQRSFLDSYRPNETHYLPEPVRRKLLEIGSQTVDRVGPD